MKKHFVAATLAAAVAIAPAASAAIIYGYTASNTLVRFDSATPGTIQQTIAVTGLVGNDAATRLQGIDFRPASGALFGINSGGTRIYSIDIATGVATQVGADLVAAPLSDSSAYGFDFNPTVDRIRVVGGGNANENLRYNPNTGALAATDTSLAYAPGDTNNGNEPNIVGVAYINNFAGATITTLYGVDGLNDVLATIVPPNSGVLNTVGALGVNLAGQVGFDIDALGNAFVSSGAGGSALYSVNLATGAATLIGDIGNGLAVIDIAATLPNTAQVSEPAGVVLLGLGMLALLRRRAR